MDVAVRASLIHIYSILLSTLLSTKRQQLSLFDADYALQICSSPLTVYLVVASICDLCGIKTGLYKRIKSHRRTTRVLGALVPFLWLGLSMILRLWNQAFKDSELCEGSTFKDWFMDFLWSLFYYIKAPGGSALYAVFYSTFGSAFVICVFVVRSQVTADVRAYWNRSSRPWGRLCIPWVFMKSTWCVVVGPAQPNLTP